MVIKHTKCNCVLLQETSLYTSCLFLWLYLLLILIQLFIFC